MKILGVINPFLLASSLLLAGGLSVVSGSNWMDFVVGGIAESTVEINTLSLQEIGNMRVRDIKRRLTRTHGYDAYDVGRMLDKNELINALASEEQKIRERQLDQQKRFVAKRGLIASVVVALLVVCWPLLSHLFTVAAVNVVVYTDKKKFEAKRCYELQSWAGLFLIVLMFILDCLQLWLSASTLLSWFVKSKYFFPVPSLPMRPAQLMGGEVAIGPLAKYQFNLGPVLVSWLLRFGNGRIEKWAGRALANAQQELRRKPRENETDSEERKARKAARRAAKQASRNEANVPATEETQQPAGPSPKHDYVFEPNHGKEPPMPYETASVKDFLGEEFDYREDDTWAPPEGSLEQTSALDDLD